MRPWFFVKNSTDKTFRNERGEIHPDQAEHYGPEPVDIESLDQFMMEFDFSVRLTVSTDGSRESSSMATMVMEEWRWDNPDVTAAAHVERRFKKGFGLLDALKSMVES